MLRAVFLYEKFLQFSLPHVEYYEKFLRRSDAFCSHSRQLKCQHHRRHHDDDHKNIIFFDEIRFQFKILFSNFFRKFFFDNVGKHMVVIIRTKHWTLSSEKSRKNVGTI